VGLVRRHPIIVAFAAVCLVIVGLVSATALAVWRAAHQDEASRVDRVDLIAVLGAAEYGGRPSPTLQGRLEHAALLYRERFADRVLVLGGSQPGDITTEAAAGRSWLISDGLPASDVFAEPKGSNTLQSIQAAAAFMKENHLTTVFLVSDPWHNLRIRRIARDLQVEAFASATWSSAAKSRGTRFRGYLRETFAYLYYRILGR
jgi:vancomycin permeability regulator SanA